MKGAISRAIIKLASCCLDESRREWAAAMQAEFETASAEGKSLPFATGCLVAAWRDMLVREEGRFTLTSYALALGLMIPMAGLQIGCAVLGFSYLYPGQRLTDAVLVGGEHEMLLRSLYQAAVPTIALLLLLLGIGHLWIAWAMLERDWDRVRRIGALAMAAATTLIIFMTVLFLNSSHAWLLIAVLAIELAAVRMFARWHAQIFVGAVAEHPG